MRVHVTFLADARTPDALFGSSTTLAVIAVIAWRHRVITATAAY